jgi:DNA polymerase III sliding clamp (beta) subunit (PCNA family)
VTEQVAGYDSVTFTMRRQWLAQLADWAVAAVPSGTPTLPVNGCFRVDVEAERITVAATDQQLSVFATTQAVETKTPGVVFLPAKRLRELLSVAPEGDVTIAVKGMSARVTAGSASWSLRLFPAGGYLGLPDLSGSEFAEVGRESLLRALQAVRHAVGKDLGRPSYTQVRIAQSGGCMAAMAADSSQFARARLPGFPFPLSIPLVALDDLTKLLAKGQDDMAQVAETDSLAVFRVGYVTLAAARSGSEFPDPALLLPLATPESDRRLVVDKAELTGALRRARVNADARTSAVALIASGEGGRATLTVMAKDKDGNSAQDTIDAADWSQPTADGREPVAGEQQAVVNAVFLETMLAAHRSAACEFRLGRDRGAVRFPVLLEDDAAGIVSTCTQMTQVGYS